MEGAQCAPEGFSSPLCPIGRSPALPRLRQNVRRDLPLRRSLGGGRLARGLRHGAHAQHAAPLRGRRGGGHGGRMGHLRLRRLLRMLRQESLPRRQAGRNADGGQSGLRVEHHQFRPDLHHSQQPRLALGGILLRPAERRHRHPHALSPQPTRQLLPVARGRDRRQRKGTVAGRLRPGHAARDPHREGQGGKVHGHGDLGVCSLRAHRLQRLYADRLGQREEQRFRHGDEPHGVDQGF